MATITQTSTHPPSFNFSRKLRLKMTGAPHTLTTIPNSTGASPSLDPSITAQDFYGDVAVSTELPSQADLRKAGEIPVLAADGTSRPFKSLYSGEDGQAKRVLVIFVRHFFCGICQEYLRTLSHNLPLPSTLLSLPTPTSITIIGCGDPSLIPMYAAATNNCPYPIYADPSRRLYDILGMTRTLSLGNKKPEYIHKSLFVAGLESIVQGLKSGSAAWRGGDYRQVGGEFLFEVSGGDAAEEGAAKAVWCSRMRNTRGHVEVDVLRRILGLAEDTPVDEGESDSHDEAKKKKRWSLRSSIASERRRSSSSKRSGSTKLRKEPPADNTQEQRPPGEGEGESHDEAKKKKRWSLRDSIANERKRSSSSNSQRSGSTKLRKKSPARMAEVTTS